MIIWLSVEGLFEACFADPRDLGNAGADRDLRLLKWLRRSMLPSTAAPVAHGIREALDVT
jgi:hypothetical protein